MTTFSERFATWEKDPPPHFVGDPIWRLPAYRIALFLSDVAMEDAALLMRDRAPHHISSQLHESVDSIRSNISEGYSRLSGRERARFYEIALGSAREARDWYGEARSWLGHEQATERGALLTRVIKILTVAIPRERAGESEKRILGKRSLPPRGDPSPSPSNQD